jgi:hypothetical protein
MGGNDTRNDYNVWRSVSLMATLDKVTAAGTANNYFGRVVGRIQASSGAATNMTRLFAVSTLSLNGVTPSEPINDSLNGLHGVATPLGNMQAQSWWDQTGVYPQFVFRSPTAPDGSWKWDTAKQLPVLWYQ